MGRKLGSGEELPFKVKLTTGVVFTSLWPLGSSKVGVCCGRRGVEEDQGM